ncbi:MAG: 3-keto-disaccharide hydrolase [Planctomycetia bacterium]
MKLPRRAFHRSLVTGAAFAAALNDARPAAAEPSPSPGAQWYSLFDGKTLNGWTPKIRYEDYGEDKNRTFRVADGMIQIRYDGYQTYVHQRGSLFFNEPFSRYRLRFEYRIVGPQCEGGPDWALRRTSVMFHAEDPRMMDKDRELPVGLVVQLHGGDGVNSCETACLYSLGTRVVHDGRLSTAPYLRSTSKTFHGDQWVTVELEVRGAGKIIHRVNGETVLSYEQPQYDPNDEAAKKLIRGDGILALEGGCISLLSESQPADYRNIQIMLFD